MNVNVVFFSPRYLRYEFFGMLLRALNIKSIYSFLPVSSLPYSSADAIRRYENFEFDQNCENFDKYISFINSIVETVWNNMLDKEVADTSKRGSLTVPTILVLADWEVSVCGVKHYNQYLLDASIKFKRWENVHDTFPYRNQYGDLTDDFVSILQKKAGDDYLTHLYEHVFVRKLSVYFSNHAEFVRTFDFRDGRWHCYVFKNRKTGKMGSYIQLWRQKTAHDNEESLVYVNEEGKKKIRAVTLDVMSQDVSKWRQYQREEEERRLRMEYCWGWGEDYNNDDREQGCGNGWSCSNCPNAGCPANELN